MDILPITFIAYLDLAPKYVKEMLTPYEPAHRLRSSSRALLFQSQSQKTISDPALASYQWKNVNHYLKPIFRDWLSCDAIVLLHYFNIDIIILFYKFYLVVYFYQIDWFYVSSGFNSYLSLSFFVVCHCWAFCCFIALLCGFLLKELCK